MLKSQELVVTSLGQCQYASPLNERSTGAKDTSYFVSDSDRIRLDVVLRPGPIDADPLSLEMAGPRQHIFFRPDETTAAIVTCGGLSPGLNNVIRSVFYELTENYGVQSRARYPQRLSRPESRVRFGADCADQGVCRTDRQAGWHRAGQFSRRPIARRDGRLSASPWDRHFVLRRWRRHAARCACAESRVAKPRSVGGGGRHPQDDRQRHPFRPVWLLGTRRLWRRRPRSFRVLMSKPAARSTALASSS